MTVAETLAAVVAAVNLAAGAYGGYGWLRWTAPPGFWPLLRTAQAAAAVQAIAGLVLAATGADLPRLYLVYALTPVLVAFFAEQLRLVSAQTELDRRNLKGRDDVAALPAVQQEVLVEAIVRREIGVMAASALVVAVLGVRASGWL